MSKFRYSFICNRKDNDKKRHNTNLRSLSEKKSTHEHKKTQKRHNAMKFCRLEDHNENQGVLKLIRYCLATKRRLFEA